MKTVLSFLFFFVFMATNAQINWMTMEQAINAQKKNPKKIIINFYSDSNTSSKLMDQQTYAHPQIVKYINEKFYAVKFNALGDAEVSFYDRVFKNTESNSGKGIMNPFAKFMNINSCPAIIFLDEKGQTITNLNGLFSAHELEPYLTMIGSDDYKDIKTREQWENYQKRFKFKIKE